MTRRHPVPQFTHLTGQSTAQDEEMAMPLLTTKLHLPRPRPDLVPRPRLIERLKAGLCRKLTIVSALAGFGKRVLSE